MTDLTLTAAIVAGLLAWLLLAIGRRRIHILSAPPYETYQFVDAPPCEKPGVHVGMRCRLCGNTTYNSDDVQKRFCPFCHVHHEAVQ